MLLVVRSSLLLLDETLCDQGKGFDVATDIESTKLNSSRGVQLQGDVLFPQLQPCLIDAFWHCGEFYRYTLDRRKSSRVRDFHGQRHYFDLPSVRWEYEFHMDMGVNHGRSKKGASPIVEILGRWFWNFALALGFPSMEVNLQLGAGWVIALGSPIDMSVQRLRLLCLNDYAVPAVSCLPEYLRKTDDIELLRR
jgi:hypothetical protein